jgi:dUTP pyrophosphatase
MSIYNTYVLKLFPVSNESREMYMKALDNKVIKSFPENDNAGFDLFVDSYGEKNSDGFLLAKLGVRGVMVNNFTKQTVHYWMAPRSSIWKNGVTLANSMGVIDRTYRGELMAALHVHSDKPLDKGIRLVQVLAPDMGHISEVRICDESELDTTVRGTGGFGSTGK